MHWTTVKALQSIGYDTIASGDSHNDLGTTFKAMVEQMFQGAATAKGALIITPETVIVTTPGAENKKVL